jgi:transcription elongation factor GreA
VENDDSKYLSKDGFERLKQELQVLKERSRKEIAERLEYAKSLGDLSENAEYQAAKEEQLANETRIVRIEELLGQAVLISEKKPGLFVELGSTVLVRKENNSDLEKYTIVGSEEADPSAQKISNDSPLGRTLLSKKRGEKITVHTPKGQVKYSIIDIL